MKLFIQKTNSKFCDTSITNAS